MSAAMAPSTWWSRASLRALATEVFDLDRHWIPPRHADPGHHHYDLRFLLEADPREPLTCSSESKDLAWVELDRVIALNPEESMARMDTDDSEFISVNDTLCGGRYYLYPLRGGSCPTW